MRKAGWKVQFVMGRQKGQEGYCIVRKGNTVYRATSETNAHKLIFGY
jgi:hypothetical protein